jgi:signal transduction histidine kinase/CheY-like chemotaxis protein/HPt (histidine-containing phosphotransfer) domain-containing protein
MSAQLPAPDHGAVPRWHALAPWAVRGSLTIVVALGLGAPFLLEAPQAVWMSPLLITAAFGGWIGWRVYASDHPTEAPGAAVAPAAGAVDDARLGELQGELEKLRSMQAELVQAKQTAEAAMMSKSEFLATMSHEIRTPLNGIIPLLDILMSSQLGPDQKDYLQTAYKSACELLRIVDDILDYSKIEASKLVLESVALNLRETLDSVKRLLDKNAEAKHLRFSVNIDPGVRMLVRGDPVRLRQVLTNLVSNAIKFTPRGAVVVQVGKRSETRTHSEIMFVVKDSGIGIAPEAAAKLFQPFSQADASTTRMHGGTGLGLVICKRLVELMNGKIGVRSELGKGSVFWFSVPFLKAPGDVENVRRSLRGARALVLSGDGPLLKRLNSYFSTWGIEYVGSSIAPDALTKLRSAAAMGDSWAYDVLLVDINTVGGNPSVLLRNVVRDAALERLHVVFVLADREVPADVAAEKRALSVPRRFSERELQDALRRLLEVYDPATDNLAVFAAPAPAEALQVQILQPEGGVQPLSGHVLLVEDNDVNRQVAQRLLTLSGLSFSVAENGKEAVDALAGRGFDAVLMDCQMPIMDGYTATRVLREREAESGGARVPVIAMTANAMAGDREKCLGAGMDDYLTKPLNRALLEQTLRKWLRAGAPNRPDATVRAAKATPAAPPAAAAPVAMAAAPAATAEPAPASSAGALDTSVIGDLVDVMGDEFPDLVRVYLEDTPKNVALLEQAARERSMEGIIAPSHSLKSTSANLGALRLSELAKRLEHGARTGELTEPLLLVGELKREFQQVASALTELLAKDRV